MSDPRIIIAQTPKWEREKNQADTALKQEMLVQERQALARRAFDACWNRRHDLGRALHEGRGVWVEEFAPLTPTERGIVLDEFKRVLHRPVELRSGEPEGAIERHRADDQDVSPLCVCGHGKFLHEQITIGRFGPAPDGDWRGCLEPQCQCPKYEVK